MLLGAAGAGLCPWVGAGVWPLPNGHRPEVSCQVALLDFARGVFVQVQAARQAALKSNQIKNEGGAHAEVEVEVGFDCGL